MKAWVRSPMTTCQLNVTKSGKVVGVAWWSRTSLLLRLNTLDTGPTGGDNQLTWSHDKNIQNMKIKNSPKQI